MLKNRILDKTHPLYKTSAELEEAVQRHREYTQKLLSESRERRAEALNATPGLQADHASNER